MAAPAGNWKATLEDLRTRFPRPPSESVCDLNGKVALVLDIGSFETRAGLVPLSGHEEEIEEYLASLTYPGAARALERGRGRFLPQMMFPSLVGRFRLHGLLPPNLPPWSGFTRSALAVGRAALHNRGVLTVKSPVQNGFVTSWDCFEELLHQVRHGFGLEIGPPSYANAVHTDPESVLKILPTATCDASFSEVDPKELYDAGLLDPIEYRLNFSSIPVILSLNVPQPLANIEKATQIVMENWVPRSFSLQPSAILTLVSLGRRTGLVVDLGSEPSIVPVYEGCVVFSELFRAGLSSPREVTNKLVQLIEEYHDVAFATTTEVELVEDWKRKHAYVAPRAVSEPAEIPNFQCVDVNFQAGSPEKKGTLALGRELYECAEIFFHTSEVETPSIQEQIMANLTRIASEEMRAEIASNIVITGGSSVIPGFVARLEHELALLWASEDGLSSPLSITQADPLSAWIGAGILANSPSFAKDEVSIKTEQ